MRPKPSSRRVSVVTTVFTIVLLASLLPSAAAASRPTISLTPTSGAPGTLVTVEGDHFDRGRDATLTFGSTPVDCCFRPDRNGRFATSFTVPEGYSGEVTVTAELRTTTASAVFTVPSAAPGPEPSPEPEPEHTPTPEPEPTPDPEPEPAPDPEPEPEPAPDPDPDPDPEPAPDPDPVPVPVPDGEQRVVFTAEPSADCAGPCGQQTAIWQMAADGSGASALTVPGAAFDRFARWSPDGTRVAFTRTAHAGGGAEVYVQSAGASSARRVSDTAAANGGAGCSPDTTVPVWAPDATRLAFACATDDARQSRVYVVAADGSAQWAVAATATAADTAPTWSPASDRLAFARTDTAAAYGTPGRVSIWTADVDAGGPSNVRVLVSGPAAAGHPAWSPAGDEIAYVATDELDLRTALRAVPAAGGASRLVYDAPDDQLVTLYAPVWSPNAARLAVAVGDGLTTSTITVVNATTRHATPVTPTGTLAYTPTWSPTSAALICDLITPSGAHHVATVTTDGTYQALPLPARHTYDANWGS